MTWSLLLKQPQMQNTQDAVVARSEEVGSTAREAASNKQSRIWAPVEKCKRKPFKSNTTMRDKAKGPWEALVFTGGAFDACGRECLCLAVGGKGLQRPLASIQDMQRAP